MGKLSPKELEAKRQWRAKNPGYMKEYAEVHKEELRYKAIQRHYKRKYGITLGQYMEMVEKQNGQCKLCGFKPAIRLAVDHDHKTGKIRGLLCTTCNRVIMGRFDKDKWFIRKLILYTAGLDENSN